MTRYHWSKREADISEIEFQNQVEQGADIIENGNKQTLMEQKTDRQILAEQ